MIGGALGLLGAGLALLPAALGDRTTARRTLPNQPVNASAAEPRDLTSHNSPALARSPRDSRLLVVAGRIDTPDYGCALHVSTNGGHTWSPGQIPDVPRDHGGKCYAPDAVFGADGTLHVSFVTLQGRGNAPAAGWVTESDDGGRSFSVPRRVTGPLAFSLRLAADPTEPGRIWITWLQGEEVGVRRFTTLGNPVLIRGSEDGGKSWSRPVTVSDPARARVVAPSPAAARDGRLVVAYLDLGEDRLDYEGWHEGRGGPPYAGPWALMVARSADGGRRWTQEVVEDGLTPVERIVAFTAPFPAVALAPEGRDVYVAFQDGRLGDADVLLWTSGDAGANWSDPVRVNDTRFRDGTSQTAPQLALAGDGRVDVVYYDRRRDPENRLTEASLQSRLPDGTITPRLPLSDRRFDSEVAPGAERGMPDFGSRLGLAAGRDDAIAVWADARAGTPVAVKQDLAVALVEVERTGRAGTVARAASLPAGALLAGAGLLVAAGLPRGRRRRRAEPAT